MAVFMDQVSLNLRDILLFAAFLLVRDGIPWMMRTVFPAWWQRLSRRENAELAIKERELELRREIAERDQIIDNRNTRAIESIQKSTEKIADSLTAQAMQIAGIGQSVTSLRMESSDYFREGRKAIKEIAIMSSTRKPRNAKRVKTKGRN